MQNSPTRSSIDVGSIIDETYTIEALIGRGGMGAVYLASHRRLSGKKVAIKMLHANLGGDDVLARFKREADIASTLDHPNIVKVENYNVLADGTPYIAYEFLQGESLAERLAAGPLPLEQTFAIIRGVGSGLGAAHRAGIVHRDLKPQNIFLVQSEVAGNAVEMAKVLDFGISKLLGSQTVKTQESTLLGTPQYMAPEQATGQHSTVDERTDVFALGAITYEMVTGRPAFSGDSIPEVVFKVVYEQPAPLDVAAPPNVTDAIARAMAKSATNRFPTIGAFVEALTGQPLALPARITRPPPISSGEQKKISANEAFARTVGSADHGAVPDLGMTATTMPVDAETSPSKRSPLFVAGLVLAAAVAASAVFIATRPEPREPSPVVSLPPAQQQQQLQQQVVAPVDAAIAPIDAAAPPDASASPSRPPLRAHETAARVDTSADATAATRLDAVEKALRDQDFYNAELLANMVTTDEHASMGQRAHAHALHGILMCKVHRDLEAAIIDLRGLDGFSAIRLRMLKECHAAGFFADQK